MEYPVICWISFAANDSARHEHDTYTHTLAKSEFKRLKCGDKVCMYSADEQFVRIRRTKGKERDAPPYNKHYMHLHLQLHSHQKLSGVDSLYATISSCVCIAHDETMFARNVLNDNQRAKSLSLCCFVVNTIADISSWRLLLAATATGAAAVACYWWT